MPNILTLFEIKRTTKGKGITELAAEKFSDSWQYDYKSSMYTKDRVIRIITPIETMLFFMDYKHNSRTEVFLAVQENRPAIASLLTKGEDGQIPGQVELKNLPWFNAYQTYTYYQKVGHQDSRLVGFEPNTTTHPYYR